MTPARLTGLDAARGAALCAMFVYHLVWDLGFYQLVDPALPEQAWFKWFGHTIASIFLALAGAGLVLAWRRANPWPGFWRRLAMIGAAAAAVTLASLWFTPEAPIYFGILHCIALGSLLAPLFLRAPLWIVFLSAALVLAAPLMVQMAALDAPALSWLGLGTIYPDSEDFRPLSPWFGAMLAGIFGARVWQARGAILPAGPDWLAWMGRHSLVIYLVHQPVLSGLVALAAMALPAPARAPDGVTTAGPLIAT